MENIFESITKSLPKPEAEDIERLNNIEKPPARNADVPLKDLVARWQKSGSEEDTSLLLKKMEPTIKAAMTSYAPGMEKQLSIKAAKLTLDALKTYDPAYGTDPATHAFHSLKRLNRYGIQRNEIIHQSEGRTYETRMLSDISNTFEVENGREPTLEELADKTGFSKKKIEKLMDSGSVLSATATLTTDSGNDTMVHKDVTDKDYFEYVYMSVGPIDKKIMEWSSGMHGKKQLSNNEIADKLHISGAAVSQRKQKIQQLMSEVRAVI